jgi:hypothetical protein
MVGRRRRDVVVAGGRCDAVVDGIVLDASVVGTIAAGAVFGPDPAVLVWSPLHAETANSNAIAPAQRRRHTVLSIPGWRDRVYGTPRLETLTRQDTTGGSDAK